MSAYAHPPAPVEPQSARQALAAALVGTEAGDEAALRSLYDATAPKLMAVAMALLDDEAEAETLLADVYLTAWSRAGDYDPHGALAPLPWLAAILRQRALDRLRARGGARSAERGDDEGGENGPTLTEADDRRYMERAFTQGLTYRDLGAREGVSAASAEQAVRRALDRLPRTGVEAAL